MKFRMVIEVQKPTSSSVRRTNTPASSKGCMIFLIPERSVTLAIRVPSYRSLSTQDHKPQVNGWDEQALK